MKVNIYYGGRGLIEDPTIYIINKITSVLEELRVEVNRINLYEKKNEISLLPKTLKEVDAIILASTIEWFGIGGYMQQFLDSCWLYADKNKLQSQIMYPIITSNSFEERESVLYLRKAWELLGGKTLNGLSIYISNHVDFEMNSEYSDLLEEEAERFYRHVNKDRVIFDSSTLLHRNNLERNRTVELSPQESEQLSVYVSDDIYVKKQKEDIEELTQLFKSMLDKNEGSSSHLYIDKFKDNFKPTNNFSGSFSLLVEDINKTLIIEIENESFKSYYGIKEDADVIIKANKTLLNDLILGRTTLHGSFMSGNISAKGDFQKLRTFDKLFDFKTQ